MNLPLPPHYELLSYRDAHAAGWGSGDYLKSLPLPPQIFTVWDSLKDLQDKRNDTGHGEMVTVLSYKLAQVNALSAEATRVAVLSAILHDTGYSQIDQINEKFRTAQALKRTDPIAGARADRILRVQHQEFSVQIAKQLLADDPALSLICAIVGDHDTRDNPPPTSAEGEPVGAVMWDADCIARFSLPTARSYYTAEDDLFTVFDNQLKKTPFIIESSRDIARAEIENTVAMCG